MRAGTCTNRRRLSGTVQACCTNEGILLGLITNLSLTNWSTHNTAGSHARGNKELDDDNMVSCIVCHIFEVCLC